MNLLGLFMAGKQSAMVVMALWDTRRFTSTWTSLDLKHAVIVEYVLSKRPTIDDILAAQKVSPETDDWFLCTRTTTELSSIDPES